MYADSPLGLLPAVKNRGTERKVPWDPAHQGSWNPLIDIVGAELRKRPRKYALVRGFAAFPAMRRVKKKARKFRSTSVIEKTKKSRIDQCSGKNLNVTTCHAWSQP